MEEEISLRELIETVWAGKGIIITITLIAMLISVLFSVWLITPIYKAKTLIAVNESNFPKDKEGRGLEALLDAFTRMPQVSVQSYLSLAKSDSVIMKTMERLNLDTQKTPLKKFANKIKVTNISDTELLEITVKDPSPQRAAEIANILAEELIECGAVINKDKNRQNLELLEKQLQEEQANFVGYEEELKQFFEQPHSIVELQAELETNLLLFSEFQARKANLQIETQKTSIAIVDIEKQLSALPETIELHKNGEDLKSEELNPVYQELKKELALKKALLAQLNAEKKLVEAETEKSSNNIKSLQVRLADKKAELEQMQMDMEIAKENYVLLQKKFTESKITEAIKFSEVTLTIIRPAFAPQEPAFPKKTLNLMVATSFGLMLGVFVVIFRCYWAKAGVKRSQDLKIP